MEFIRTATLLIWTLTSPLHAETTPVHKASSPSTTSDPVNLSQILNAVDATWRGRSAKGTLQMTVKTAHYTRTMKMDYASLGEEFFLVRIAEPKKEKGTATLKRRDEIYNYLPKIDRTIKISTAMMGSSWMGSHFTNDDLVQSTRLADDYTSKLLGRERKGDKTVHTIELIPKPDAPVVWGKTIITVAMPGAIPIEQKFYDEDMKMVRKLTFSDIKNLDDRTIPTKLKVTPLDKPNEYTELTYLDIDFGVTLDESYFGLNQLKAR